MEAACNVLTVQERRQRRHCQLPPDHALTSVIQSIYAVHPSTHTENIGRIKAGRARGLRRKISTLDHIITCCRLIEVAREYQEPLVLTFVDYKKVFDSVEPAKIWEALEEQGMEGRYTYTLSKCYSGCTTIFRPFLNDVEVAVEKEVRQGDPIAPNLFSACPEAVICRYDWSNFGINIDGMRLNHLRFADDIVLITRSPNDASEMLHTPTRSEAKLALSSTKRKPSHAQRLFQRASSAPSRKLRAGPFNSTVLPALCYASETWTLTKSIETQLRSSQLALERRLVWIDSTPAT